MQEKTVKCHRLIQTHNHPPPFHVGCPLTNNRSCWCYALCVPVRGLGACGRVAPHGLRGRTQRAIDQFKQQKTAENQV